MPVVQPAQVAGRVAVEVDALRGVEDGVYGEPLLGLQRGRQSGCQHHRQEHGKARKSMPIHV